MGDYDVIYKMFKVYILLQRAGSAEPNAISVMFIEFLQAVGDSVDLILLGGSFQIFRVK